MHFTTLITQCLKPRLALKVSPEPSNYISYMQKALQIFLHVLFWSGSTLCALLHGTVLRWGIGKSSAWTLEWNRCISQDSKAFAAFVIQFIRDKETCCDYFAKGCEQGTVETGHVCQALIRTWKFLRSFLKQLWNEMQWKCRIRRLCKFPTSPNTWNNWMDQIISNRIQ